MFFLNAVVVVFVSFGVSLEVSGYGRGSIVTTRRLFVLLIAATLATSLTVLRVATRLKVLNRANNDLLVCLRLQL